MEPIRVLHVFGGLDSGGAESRTMDIYRNIDKEKVQFDFLIHTDKRGFFEDEIRKMGGRIHRIPRLSLKNFILYQTIVKDFFELHSEYKIVHGHMLSTAFIYLKVAKSKGIPIRIAHSRNSNKAKKNLVSKIKRLTNKVSPIYATHMFAVSKMAGYGLFGEKRMKSGKVKIIPNAIDSKKYIFNTETRNKLREELKLNDNLTIGHIGRFHPVKNHMFLLEIFSEIKKLEPKSKLILIGDGPMKLEINEKISTLGLEASVNVLGIRDDVKDVIQAMDVLVFPSIHEGLPGVVLEAQAAGLPCVISNNITHEVKVTNLVEFESLNMEKKQWALKTINVANTHERKNTHAEFVESGFDIDSITKWYENFYLRKASTN